MLGTVKLAQGKSGFYDPLTKIHLTPMCPESYVREGMNTDNLKRGVQFGSIKLTSGTLDTIQTVNIQQPIYTSIPAVNEQVVDKSKENTSNKKEDVIPDENKKDSLKQDNKKTVEKKTISLTDDKTKSTSKSADKKADKNK